MSSCRSRLHSSRNSSLSMSGQRVQEEPLQPHADDALGVQCGQRFEIDVRARRWPWRAGAVLCARPRIVVRRCWCRTGWPPRSRRNGTPCASRSARKLLDRVAVVGAASRPLARERHARAATHARGVTSRSGGPRIETAGQMSPRRPSALPYSRCAVPPKNCARSCALSRAAECMQPLHLLRVGRRALAHVRTPQQPLGAEAVRQRAHECGAVEVPVFQPVEIDVGDLEVHMAQVAEPRDAVARCRNPAAAGSRSRCPATRRTSSPASRHAARRRGR